MTILIPVSMGDLIDRLTILNIKAKRIEGLAKLRQVHAQITQLLDPYLAALRNYPAADQVELVLRYERLEGVNGQLWDVEERLRQKDQVKEFDEAFTELARQVFMVNDQRALIKREIDELVQSDIREQKSYV